MSCSLVNNIPVGAINQPNPWNASPQFWRTWVNKCIFVPGTRAEYTIL